MVKTIGKDRISILKLTSLDSDPTSPVEGQMYYNTTDKKIKYYDGSEFIDM